MKRREMVHTLGSASVLGLFSNVLSTQTWAQGVKPFTVRRSDILAVADAAGVDRFAWFGFSFGGVVGLQLASRTNRLSALVCGGWPPLGGQYAETLAYAEEGAAQG